jgi:signal transduction histidine kinase
MPDSLRKLTLACCLAAASVLAVPAARGGLFLTAPYGEHPALLAVALFLIFLAGKRFTAPLAENLRLDFGLIFIYSSLLIFGPWIIIPLAASGLAAGFLKKERGTSLALNIAADVLRIIPGALFYEFLGGSYPIASLTPRTLLAAASLSLWCASADYLMMRLFAGARDAKPFSRSDADFLPVLIDLLFAPISLAAALLYTRLGASYILTVLLPLVFLLLLYRYAIAKRSENRELKRLNEELQALTEEKQKLYEQSVAHTALIRKAQQRIVQSEKLASVGRLAAGVAHELNTPLGTVLTNAEFALSFIEDEDGRESLEKIRKGALRCRNITEKLLNYARARKTEITAFPVSRLVEGALDILDDRVRHLNISIDRQVGDDLMVAGNFDDLSCVLTNLASNAADAIEEGKPERGHIAARAWKDEEGFVRILIKDNGAGIEPENLGRIFDPFFTTKDVGKGTGLGLSTSMNIVREHGGKILVKSEPGEGAEFVVVLPGNRCPGTKGEKELR